MQYSYEIYKFINIIWNQFKVGSNFNLKLLFFSFGVTFFMVNIIFINSQFSSIHKSNHTG